MEKIKMTYGNTGDVIKKMSTQNEPAIEESSDDSLDEIIGLADPFSFKSLKLDKK